MDAKAKEAYADELFERVLAETRASFEAKYTCEIRLDLAQLLIRVSQSRLGLRHPLNNGEATRTAQKVISGIVRRLRADGYPANAEAMEKGNDPAYDVPRV